MTDIVDLDLREKLKVFVNSHDIFWIRELKDYLEINDFKADQTSHPNYKTYQQMTGMLRSLVVSGYIQCCEKRKSERQYLRIKKLENGDIIMIGKLMVKHIN